MKVKYSKNFLIVNYVFQIFKHTRGHGDTTWFDNQLFDYLELAVFSKLLQNFDELLNKWINTLLYLYFYPLRDKIRYRLHLRTPA